jgi:HEXXH motif-containing protein
VSDIDLSAIDWSRMAEPQEDQYDSKITLALATSGRSPLRAEPHVRRATDGCHTICDGTVAVRYFDQEEMAPPHFELAPQDHPNLSSAVEYLRRWPAAYEQFKTLIDTVHPCLDPQITPELRDITVGSSSHSYEKWFGAVFVTVDHHIGCAQALVHEMAHQKLRALGVSLEQAWRLVANDPAELYPSPIKIGQRRPMTAVLHAEYSFIYVTQLDIRMLEAETDEASRDQILQLLMRNVVRMEAGYDTLARNIKTDRAGAAFIEAFLGWAGRVIERGYVLLNENGYETKLAAS